ncbi:MAG: HAMP domain-containing protein [Solirubrobacteraceae bacterium]|nr:HAMP domain-containing protein [Solirubrobacteraceae bacterium]
MSLRTLLLAALTYVVLLTVIAFAVPLSRVLGERVNREVRTQATAEAQLVAAAAGADATSRVMEDLVAVAARTTRGRVIVVDQRGSLQYDSATPSAARGTDYASRPEIAAGLAGEQYQEQRDSQTLNRTLLVTVVPAREDGRIVGAVRVSQDVGAISRAVNRGRLALLALGLLVLALGGAVAAVLARRLAQPLAALEDAARAVAGGDMTAIAPERGSREQVSVARTFNAMTERLDRTLTAQQQFVANASHQLRTPLTGVRLRIEEALAEHPGPQAAEHLEAATAEVDRLAALIDDLLVLGRSGERPQAARPVDLREVAESVAGRLQPAADQVGRELRVSGDAASSILADRDDLERALDALAENALTYGQGPVDIVVRGRRVEVCDRGPGLAPGELDGRLLERFQRGSAGRSHAGTGLGLAIATALAARWGGSVALQPRDGGGAVASIEFAESA